MAIDDASYTKRIDLGNKDTLTVTYRSPERLEKIVSEFRPLDFSYLGTFNCAMSSPKSGFLYRIAEKNPFVNPEGEVCVLGMLYVFPFMLGVKELPKEVETKAMEVAARLIEPMNLWLGMRHSPKTIELLMGYVPEWMVDEAILALASFCPRDNYQ